MESSSTEIDSIEISEDEISEEQDTYFSKYGQISSSEDECFVAEEIYLSEMSFSEEECSEKEETRLSKSRQMGSLEEECSEMEETRLSKTRQMGSSEEECSEKEETRLSKTRQMGSSEEECSEKEETRVSKTRQMGSSEEECSEKEETRLSKTRQMGSSEEECSEKEETRLSETPQMGSSEEECSEKAYLSENGEISWCTSAPDKGHRVPAQNVLKITQGPTRFCISQAQDITSTFMSFFPGSMEKIIIDMTNLEGERRFSNDWQELTATEFKAFMGLLILAGGFQSSKESIGKLWDRKMGRWIFRATMSRKRFFDLLHVVTFDNPESRALRESTDKLAAIRDVWDTWSSNLSIMYDPGHDITIDEHLVPFRGSCPFREYMPHIPSKSGIKLWVACDSRSSYCWKVQVYTGKPPGEETEENLAKRVVLDLSEGLKGQNVTLGSFFTSFDLGQELLKKKLTMTGEVLRSRPELPSDFLISEGRRLHSSKFGFFSNTTIVSYLEKSKNMLLMSTFHQNPAISSRVDRKPCILTDYDETRGGVDTMNKLTAAYSTIRKTSRWTLALFCDMLDIAAHNACVVWNVIGPKGLDKKESKRKVFLVQLGEALVAPTMQQRSYVHGMERLGKALVATTMQEWLNIPRDCAAARLGVVVQKGLPAPHAPLRKSLRRRCVFCASRLDRKTSIVCRMCGRFVCKSHSNAICICCAKFSQ